MDKWPHHSPSSPNDILLAEIIKIVQQLFPVLEKNPSFTIDKKALSIDTINMLTIYFSDPKNEKNLDHFHRIIGDLSSVLNEYMPANSRFRIQTPPGGEEEKYPGQTFPPHQIEKIVKPQDPRLKYLNNFFQILLLSHQLLDSDKYSEHDIPENSLDKTHMDKLFFLLQKLHESDKLKEENYNKDSSPNKKKLIKDKDRFKEVIKLGYTWNISTLSGMESFKESPYHEYTIVHKSILDDMIANHKGPEPLYHINGMIEEGDVCKGYFSYRGGDDDLQKKNVQRDNLFEKFDAQSKELFKKERDRKVLRERYDYVSEEIKYCEQEEFTKYSEEQKTLSQAITVLDEEIHEMNKVLSKTLDEQQVLKDILEPEIETYLSERIKNKQLKLEDILPKHRNVSEWYITWTAKKMPLSMHIMGLDSIQHGKAKWFFKKLLLQDPESKQKFSLWYIVKSQNITLDINAKDNHVILDLWKAFEEGKVIPVFHYGSITILFYNYRKFTEFVKYCIQNGPEWFDYKEDTPSEDIKYDMLWLFEKTIFDEKYNPFQVVIKGIDDKTQKKISGKYQ